MRIVFMGTPDFAVPTLRKLIKNYEVSLVITQPDRPQGRGRKIMPSPIKKFAVANNIEVYQPENINNDESLDKLREVNADFHIIVAYGQIVSKEVLNTPNIETINVHASLLPEYRGGAPIHRALIDGKSKTGVTTMIVKSKLDSGPILLQEEVLITEEMTTGSLHDILSEKGARLLIRTLDSYDEIVPKEQDHEKHTYAKLIESEDRLINWSKSSREVSDLIRGLNPWPLAHTFYNSKRLIIYDASLVEGSAGQPSEIVKINDQGIIVSTGEGNILVKTVKPQGKRKMSAVDFVHGYQINVGDTFNYGKVK
jgi:methionyl-tRNA formyltransferase